jgi:S-DNA-T family DNA segregation ATPase FtsK/SpoIIIE
VRWNGHIINEDAGWETYVYRSDGKQMHWPRGVLDWVRLLLLALLKFAQGTGWFLALLLGFVVTAPVVAAGIVAVLVPVAAGRAGLAPLVGVLLAAGLGVWFWRWPESFDRAVSSRLRRWVRRRRYRWRWSDLMAGLNATVKDRRRRLLAPRLARIRSGRFFDVLTVRLPHGITSEAFAEHTPAIAEAMRAREARIIGHGPRRWLPRWLTARLPAEFTPGPRRPGVVRLRLAFGDPLVHTVTAVTPLSAEAVDLSAVPIGRRDDGAGWLLRLLGTHVLLAGSTGSGKGSVLWSLLAAVGPAIREGTVRVVGIDPKGGMELGYGRELFHRLVTVDGPGGDTDVVAFLEELADEADARAARLAGHVRTLRSSVDMPFLLIVVDELASLTSFIADNKLRQRGEAALGRLLTKGRAPGMCVVGAIQDPRKDVLKYRDLFPTRIALRLVAAGAVDLVLGDGARRRGARCDQISETAPGVGYVIEDGTAAVARVRAAYLTDDDVRRLAVTYRPGTTPAPALVGLPGGIA